MYSLLILAYLIKLKIEHKIYLKYDDILTSTEAYGLISTTGWSCRKISHHGNLIAFLLFSSFDLSFISLLNFLLFFR